VRRGADPAAQGNCTAKDPGAPAGYDAAASGGTGAGHDAALHEENARLKAENAALKKKSGKGLEAENAALKAEVAALKAKRMRRVGGGLGLRSAPPHPPRHSSF